MKLTKEQKLILNDILYRIKKVENFIQNETVSVSMNFGSMGKSEINKQIGSELCYLYQAVEKLEQFIEANQ